MLWLVRRQRQLPDETSRGAVVREWRLLALRMLEQYSASDVSKGTFF